MADTNETITDIIKGIRAEADYIEETARGSLKSGENYDGIAFTESDLESALDLAETKRKEADRLEAAYKREVDALKRRCAELDAEIAAKDEVIKRLNDAIAEEQRRKMATAKNSSAVGDAAKLREALMNLVDVIDRYDSNSPLWWHGGAKGVTPLKNAKAALAEPVKNCEVGTVEEQYSRMYRECYEWMCMDCKSIDKDLRKCALSWAQKPYKEGGAK